MMFLMYNYTTKGWIQHETDTTDFICPVRRPVALYCPLVVIGAHYMHSFFTDRGAEFSFL